MLTSKQALKALVVNKAAPSKADLAKQARIKAYRKEASRLAAIANKRIQRLEKADLLSSPAYKRWVDDGAVKFSVKGKSYNQVQSEVSKLNKFLSANTSTIRGTNKVLKDMAKNTGIKYKNLKELKTKSDKFFRLADKVEQYLKTVEGMGSAIGYNKIWEVINEYTQTNDVNLDDTEQDIDSLTEVVSKALVEIQNEGDKPNITGWALLN